MKYTFIAILSLLIASNSLIAQEEIKQESTIKNVTVFLSGAEVHRTAKVNLNAGSNQIIFENLSPYITPNSIQVKAKSNNVTIVSVNHQANYLTDNTNDKKLNLVKDSIEDLNFSKSIRLGHQRVYQEEKSLLITNKSIRGETNGVDVDELMYMADFYRERLLEIETKLLDIEMQLTKINKSLARLNQQQILFSKGKTKSTNEIVVNVSTKSKNTADFEISYVVTQASWIPKYDIRSSDISEPVELTYKADVFNLSGYDWKNVNITLSTGNPSIDNTQPALNPWYLKYYENYRKQDKNAGAYGYGGGSAPMARSAESFDNSNKEKKTMNSREEGKFEEDNLSIADFTQMVESNVNTEFKISIPYTINSDGKPYLVEIQDYELPVDYSYLTIPKKDKDAFLLARMSGWGSYNLLPGEANVYFEGTYVGTSYLETASTKDTLDISMGRDKGIVVSRKKVEELCKNSTLGGNHKTARAYDIEVRNNKSKPVTIFIYDQIPLNSKKEVEVTVEDLGGAEYNEKTGELKWKMTLAPGATKKATFKFQVKYPKEYNISNL
jgi:uncharacterized protein (TIGR02231 family)